ncbi:MAG: hypothetical protein MK035_07365 [Dehalococcoidia bacterium]|nr:hypothetical protein [Dehalococcoidia bacterium]
MDLVAMVNQYGLPIVVAGGMGYFIFFIWKYVTTQIKPKLGSTATVLIALIDRVRMLDNDLIRLEQKLNVFIEMKEELQLEELEEIKHEKQKK